MAADLEQMNFEPANPEPLNLEAAPGDELRRRLEEALHTLDAIQNGSVDAVVVNGPHGPQIFTLESPDHPFRTFVEGMQEGALTLAGDGTILYANTFFGTLTGVPVNELIGSSLSSLLTPGSRGLCESLIAQGLSAPVKQTLRLETQQGGIPVQLTLSPLSSGEMPTCCAVVFDLREREQAERARAEREAAEAANAAKDRFLAILGHEMRSPLNTVLGWAQILGNRSDLDATVRKAAKTIERNARAQAQLISELLDVSRIVAGKLHLEVEIVDLRAVVASAVAAARLTLDKEVQITDSSSVSDAYVLGDRTRLEQILTNLIGNAVKFTEAGGRIDVRLSQADRHLELAVSDNGSGIPSDQIDTIFELFQQLPGSRRKGGLGLGLSITKQLVEAHGGQIHVASPGAGLGSTFTVRLPRVNGPLPSADEVHEQETRLANRRILVIDDDADILELMRFALEQRGAHVETVQSAAAALEKLATGRYDVLVSDLGLPDQDGLALLAAIRADAELGRQLGRSLRAVALTGYASASDAQQCAAAGFELHLVKPISPWELARSITRLLERPPL
ncbi:MAG TPA: ATP-binding protein [Polyangiaceae bacterium]|nr:ATP-binding protein [Polyangiaceae bacterium]